MSKGWYPIINKETCIECGKCVGKCTHGVYNKSSPRKPEVVYSDGCVEGCHGCGGVCPVGAITYFGDDTGWTPPNGGNTNKNNKRSEVIMENLETNGACGCGSDCGCGTTSANNEETHSKDLSIDFLYLDLNVCERCIATGDTLDEALVALKDVFQVLNYDVKVNKINVTTEELAVQHKFISSPTIRVNGIDICNELVESECENCGDLAGCSVDCREFVYEGKEYTQPPTAAIVDGILNVLYGNVKKAETAYTLPENLKKYFIGRELMLKDAKEMFIYEPALCCETGVCGVGVDPELLRISTVANNLKSNGVKLQRYNLNNYPQEFVNNTEINKLINGEGVDALPATVVDGKIVKTKAYPTNGEIVMWLNIPADYLVEKPADSSDGDCGCGCSGGCC